MILAAVTVLALGCAGPPDVTLPGPDSTTGPLTKTQFLAVANQICRSATEAIVKRTTDVGSNEMGDGSGDRQKLVDAVEPITAQALAKLRNLTPPPEDAAVARTAIDAMQSAADAVRTDPTAPIDAVGLNRPELFDYGLTGCFTKR
jgi:hypothetical protein